MTTSNISAIGERLKKARESKALTVDQVQKQTRIHSAVLSALEAGKCDEMLNQTYVKSYLKKYSSYLGLDADRLVSEYSSASGKYSLEAQTLNVSKVDGLNRLNLSWVWAVLKVAGAILAVILMIRFTISTIVPAIARMKPKEKVERKVAAVQKTAAPSSSKKATAKNGKAKASINKSSKKKITVEEKQAVADKPVDKTSVPVAAVQAKAQDRSSFFSEPKIVNVRETIEVPEKVRESPPPIKKSFDLVVRTNDRVMIEARRDGVTLFRRELRKGSEESIKASERVGLYIAKAEAVELVLDGKSLGSPGNGIIRDLEVTKKGFRILKK